MESNHDLKIKIDGRVFNLDLRNLDSDFRERITAIFHDRSYSLEELLTMFIQTMRDQNQAEIELSQILNYLNNAR